MQTSSKVVQLADKAVVATEHPPLDGEPQVVSAPVALSPAGWFLPLAQGAHTWFDTN